LIDQAAHTGDPQKRVDIFHDAERLFLSEPAVVCIYWYTRVYLLDPSVKNWNPLALDIHNFKYIDLETEEPRLSQSNGSRYIAAHGSESTTGEGE
jgi:oligopeptide transport system substrate-binding protein